MIAHFDLDCFFVAVERLHDPTLNGKPVAVGGSPEGRGVICSASYEARKFGVRSAMPTAQALRFCPQLIVLPTRHGEYGRHSRMFAEILHEYSPLVELASIDEAYVDFSGTERLLGDPAKSAAKIVGRVKNELGFDVSVGLSSSRIISKIASSHAKPKGFLVIPPGKEREWLRPLPVEKMPGIGPRTAEAMQAAGIRTLGQLAARPVGDRWADWARYARGEVRGGVYVGETRKSLSVEETFLRDLTAGDALWVELREVCEEAGYRLRREGLTARTIGVKLKFADFTQKTAAHTLERPTDLDREIFAQALELARTRIGQRSLRLIGVHLSGLTNAASEPPVDSQLDLFAKPDPAAAKWKNLQSTLDNLRNRYGASTLQWGYRNHADHPNEEES